MQVATAQTVGTPNAEEFLRLTVGSPSDADAGRVEKWNANMLLAIEGSEANGLITDMAGTTLRRYADITGLTVGWASAASANLRIRYLNYAERNRLLKSGDMSYQSREHLARWHSNASVPCTYTARKKNGVILSADVFIKAEIDMTLVLWCIQSKLLVVHGFLHSGDVEASILGRPPPLNVTRKDRVYLRTLYANQLTPGMERDAAMALLPELLATAGQQDME